MAFRSSTERGLVVVVAVLLASGVASAEPEADEDIKRGVALRREGKDAEALEAFGRALARAPSPRARAQVALAEQALALWLAAERDLGLALAEKDDPWIRQNHEALERAAQVVAGKLAWIQVESPSATSEAQVFVNGTLAPPGADGRVRVVAGQVALELRAPGHAPRGRTVQVAPETTMRVALDLGPPIATPPPAAPRPPSRREEPDDAGLRTTGWVLIGVGAAGIGLGSFFGVRAIQKKDERDRECAVGCTQEGVDADRAGRTAGLVSTIAFAAGGLAAAAGVTLLVWPARTSSVAVTTRAAAVDLRVSF